MEKKEDREGEEGEEREDIKGKEGEWEGEVEGKEKEGRRGEKEERGGGTWGRRGEEIISVSLALFLSRRLLLLTRTIRQSIFWLK